MTTANQQRTCSKARQLYSYIENRGKHRQTRLSLVSTANMTESRKELLEKLHILQLKVREIASMIESIDATFMDLGFQVQTRANNQKLDSNRVQNGIRINGKLSFRGKEKAAELFDVVDIDRDGYLNFEDFRGNIRILNSSNVTVFSTHVIVAQPFVDLVTPLDFPNSWNCRTGT